MTNSSLFLQTDRLELIPFTLKICKDIELGTFDFLNELELKKGKNWPDESFIETLPKIVKNLSIFGFPTGFESWIIIRKDTKEIIGDAGFKGYHMVTKSADLGYGIIEAEQRKGFAIEATKELVKWAFNQPEIDFLTAACLKENTASVRILEKLDFSVTSSNEDYYFWELPRK